MSNDETLRKINEHLKIIVEESKKLVKSKLSEEDDTIADMVADITYITANLFNVGEPGTFNMRTYGLVLIDLIYIIGDVISTRDSFIPIKTALIDYLANNNHYLDFEDN